MNFSDIVEKSQQLSNTDHAEMKDKINLANKSLTINKVQQEIDKGKIFLQN